MGRGMRYLHCLSTALQTMSMIFPRYVLTLKLNVRFVLNTVTVY